MAEVFLVDRDAALRATLRRALEASGHTVTEIADDREAVARLRLAPGPAVVLVEYTHLWPDGARLAQAITSDPVAAGRHAYLLTTTDRWPSPPTFFADRAGRPGGSALAVLLKPFALETLIAAVGRAAASIAIAARSVTGEDDSTDPPEGMRHLDG